MSPMPIKTHWVWLISTQILGHQAEVTNELKAKVPLGTNPRQSRQTDWCRE